MASTNPSGEQEFKQLQRHPDYYFSGGDVQFVVENQIFRVHRYFFERESSVFRDEIRLPPTCAGNCEPFVALDVTAAEFEKLLGVFYNSKYSLFDWTVEDWTTILELSQKWKFGEVRNLAIRELGKLTIPLIERITLYQRFEVDQDLLIPLYGTLCSRPEALDEEESEAIGMKTTVLIFRAREHLRAQPSNGGMSPLPSQLNVSDVHNILRNLLDASPVSPTKQAGKRKCLSLYPDLTDL
ncbi:hypothetical protein C0992_008991 [Termitomyces sp. T32_za158]|nr:hypothetical protein C0992_008991 [Termitomyces sp. T32_za158]